MDEIKPVGGPVPIQSTGVEKLKTLVSQLEDVIKHTKDAANACKADLSTFDKFSTDLNQCEEGCKSLIKVLRQLDGPGGKDKIIKAEAASLTNGEVAASSCPANMTPPASEAGNDDDLAPMPSKLGLTPSRSSFENAGKKRNRRGRGSLIGSKKKRKNLITNYSEKPAPDVKDNKEES